jgi:signal transduction histidine kinase
MRLRLILSFALVALAAIGSVLLITRQGTASEVHTFMARGGMMGLDSLAGNLEGYYQANGSWQGVETLLQDARPGQGMGMMMGQGPWMRVADAQGNVVADNKNAAQGKLTAGERQGAIALQNLRGELIGYLVASAGNETASEQQLLAALARAGWIAAGISGGLALALAFLLSYSLLRPVGDLTRAAAKLAGGDLSQRVAVRTEDEIGSLGQAFNHMASSLEQARQAREAMTADIAHELRTPIAIQRAHLEALEDGVYPLTVENLRPVLEQTESLTRLVEDLRTLALADAGELTLERSIVDLPGLVQRLVERFQPEAGRRGIRLQVEPVPAVPSAVKAQSFNNLSLDAGRVEQILNNLLSNALRYTPEMSVVSVCVRAAGEWAEVCVADSGPGIPAEALPRLFERFYRADKSRNREAGGTGLGLAIARQLALAHGGDITAANRAEGGAEFVLRLPVRGKER